MSDLHKIIHDIKMRVNLSDVIGNVIKLQRKGGHIKGLCPFHNEKTPSFNVDDAKGMYKCFGCGKSGDHISFLTEKRGMSFKEAVEDLAHKAGMSVDHLFSHQSNQSYESSTFTKGYDLNQAACEWFQKQLNECQNNSVINYVKQRGFSKEVLNKFKIGFSPFEGGLIKHLKALGFEDALIKEYGFCTKNDKDLFRGRLMFVICDTKDRVIGFGGRSIQPDQMPKYLNSPETPLFQKSHVLFAQNIAFKNVMTEIPPLIAEGYTDVMRLYQNGFTTAVAPLGTAFTEHHLDILWRRHPSPVFCFDGDNAGFQAAVKASHIILSKIKPNYSAKFCMLPAGHDPDSYLQSEGTHNFKQLISQSKGIIDILWMGLTHKFLSDYQPSEYSSVTPEIKTSLKKEIYHATSVIQDADLQDFFKQDLLRKFNESFHYTTNKSKKSYSSLASSNQDLLKKVKQSNKKVKKIEHLQKMLLVCLKNNPTLINRVHEELVQFNGLPSRLNEFKIVLTDHPNETTEKLIQICLKNNLDDVLKQIADFETMNPVSFIKASATMHPEDLDELYNHWISLWTSYLEYTQKQKDSQFIKSKVCETEQTEEWERWKLYKMKT